MTYTHNTTIELCGEEYAATVLYEFDEQKPLIEAVMLQHKINCFYNTAGVFAPHVIGVELNITQMLNDSQLSILSDEISADALCRSKEAHEDHLLEREFA